MKEIKGGSGVCAAAEVLHVQNRGEGQERILYGIFVNVGMEVKQK